MICISKLINEKTILSAKHVIGARDLYSGKCTNIRRSTRLLLGLELVDLGPGEGHHDGLALPGVRVGGRGHHLETASGHSGNERGMYAIQG